jgi:hypothetical protein
LALSAPPLGFTEIHLGQLDGCKSGEVPDALQSSRVLRGSEVWVG